MSRSLLVVVTIFTQLISHDGFFVVSLASKTCSAKTEDCNLAEVDAAHPNLFMLDGVEVGHVQEVKLVEGRVHQLITKSLKPLLFEIPEFLSDEECEHIIKLAGKKGLFESTTLPEYEDDSAYSDEEKNENCKDLLSNDRDSDGKISTVEFSTFIKQEFSMSVSDADVDMMLQKINFDRDSDGLISEKECLKGNHVAFDKYMRYLEDNHPRERTRLSKQTWLRVTGSTDLVLRDLQRRVIQLTKLPQFFIENSEDLQVVQYGVHGHYHAHYDSTNEWNGEASRCCFGNYSDNCSLCRFMTVLYYLNDVKRGGETAFPVADEKNINQTEIEKEDRTNLSIHCYDANVVVRPARGKAVMWYNHMISNVTGLLGTHDVRSLHGGCDVLEGSKWIANNWINAPFEWKEDS
ncbi:transmembrane prolyl 4-hydroxylase-like [Pocillopora damicornis]|uniref:transmembrane prolyl 4-hydroxylase-like n=1 Tax=Pocillopora damicornis TaxID=46731 RepID=UPI000F54E147|nr:transmembrane prolyl 4-hydroxylase-like [Pocillopora damicornis]